jgi:large subunit ribosomal protein L29
MDLEPMKDLTPEELIEKEKELKRELFNLRFQAVSGRVENPSRQRQVRREIAQLKTVYREKVRGAATRSGEKT